MMDTIRYCTNLADTAGDLTKGTLYAAKLTQDATYDSSTTGFDVDWIELGSSSNSEILNWIEDYDGITTMIMFLDRMRTFQIKKSMIGQKVD